jgi:hypothetical protein
VAFDRARAGSARELCKGPAQRDGHPLRSRRGAGGPAALGCAGLQEVHWCCAGPGAAPPPPLHRRHLGRHSAWLRLWRPRHGPPACRRLAPSSPLLRPNPPSSTLPRPLTPHLKAVASASRLAWMSSSSARTCATSASGSAGTPNCLPSLPAGRGGGGGAPLRARLPVARLASGGGAHRGLRGGGGGGARRAPGQPHPWHQTRLKQHSAAEQPWAWTL